MLESYIKHSSSVTIMYYKLCIACNNAYCSSMMKLRNLKFTLVIKINSEFNNLSKATNCRTTMDLMNLKNFHAFKSNIE
jgi:acyl-ACP thioesterase